MAEKEGPVYVANETGAAEAAGQTYTFHKGVTRVREGHVLLSVVPQFFDLVSDYVHHDVEQATAAPGEQRRTGRKTGEAGT